MAVSCQVVRFQKDSSNTDGATQDVNLNFTPKAVIVFTEANTATATASNHYQWSHGFSDGTNQVSFNCRSDDADNYGDCQFTPRNDCVVSNLAETSTSSVDCSATVAFSTNKATFTWVVNDNTATWVHMMAFGGDDITNVYCNWVDAGRDTAGTQDYTGLGFNPSDGNSVLFAIGGYIGTFNGFSTDATPNFGCAVSSSKRWCVTNDLENSADPSDTWRYQTNSTVISTMTGGAIWSEVDFDSWITDGFRLDWTDPPNYTTAKVGVLVINGGKWDCGSDTTPTSTGTKSTTVAVSSNTIRGLLTATTGATSAELATATAEGRIGVGVTDGTNHCSISNIDEDNVGTMDSYRINDGSNTNRLITINGAAVFTSAFSSFGTNQFTLNYSAVDASNARYFGWVVVADSGAAPPAAPAELPAPQSHANIHQAFDNRRPNILSTIFG